eukprot:TRINITY_DN24090_c0_g1_i1.p1 TRINITY_DN24090_c0_g1~~TRINITY_DN24090_c0_g1_i1.p1  ORF type:complete len:298 (-),score=88.79 TRINITY_DN24090_c0_g1_i1:172-1065(-)
MFVSCTCVIVFFFQAEDGIRDAQESRGLGDVYKRQHVSSLRAAHSQELAAVLEKETKLREADGQRIKKLRAESAREREAAKTQMMEQLEISRCGLEAELASRRAELEQTLELQLAERSSQLDKERADELEMIISKLDAEFSETKKELEEEAQVQVVALESQMRELQQQSGDKQKKLQLQLEKEHKSRLCYQNDTQERIQELEQKLQIQSSTLASKDQLVSSKEAEVVAVRREAEQHVQMAALQCCQQVQKLEGELETHKQANADVLLCARSTEQDELSVTQAIGCVSRQARFGTSRT